MTARIAKLLGEKVFQFSPAEWLAIHRRLFEGVFTHSSQKIFWHTLPQISPRIFTSPICTENQKESMTEIDTENG